MPLLSLLLFRAFYMIRRAVIVFRNRAWEMLHVDSHITVSTFKAQPAEKKR